MLKVILGSYFGHENNIELDNFQSLVKLSYQISRILIKKSFYSFQNVLKLVYHTFLLLFDREPRFSSTHAQKKEIKNK